VSDRPAALRIGLSPDEAAAALGISRNSFDRWILPSIRVARIGRRVVVPVRELERWLDRHSAVLLDAERTGPL
jgi:hypothetical protein